MHSSEITGMVLAGGRGSRMGGLDKGLQPFHGLPLALHCLQRLRPQVGALMLNANRHLEEYARLGAALQAPVWPDSLPDYPGPLAGFLTGLNHCTTPFLLTVPCDTPLFAPDLARRLGSALLRHQAHIAMVAAPESGPQALPESRPQPVFCLLRADLKDHLLQFIQDGGRKIDHWTAQHSTVLVPFDGAGDDPRAFANANTLAELQALQSP